MNPSFAVRWMQSRGIHYGWLVAALTFLVLFLMAAALGVPGAMLQPIAQEFGWPASDVSTALALRFALYGLVGPFSAVWIERWGVKRVMAASLALVAASMGGVAFISAQWQLIALWGVLLGVGTGTTTMVLGAVVTNRWFKEHRGVVIGLLTASTATGQLAFMPLAAWMIELWGWRSALAPLAVGCLVMLVLALVFMSNHPRELGLPPIGGQQVEEKDPAEKRLTMMAPLRVLVEVLHNRTFWVLSGTFFICGLSTSGLVQTHFISLCGDFGLGPVPAASVLALMGVFDFLGTVASGWLSDRYDSRKLLFWYYGLRGLSLFWLPHSGFTLIGLGLFGAFYGLNWIATVPPTVRVTTATFGPQKAGMVLGWIFAAHQMGAAFAAWGAGVTRAVMLSYTPALYAAGAACLIAAVLAMTVARRHGRAMGELSGVH